MLEESTAPLLTKTLLAHAHISTLSEPPAFADLLDQTQRVASLGAAEYLRNFYAIRIPECIRLLTRPAAHPTVADVAAKLAVERAMTEGIGTCPSLMRDAALANAFLAGG